MECVVCGGTNFIKESGFYFCGECQTQSQELKEHAFQEEAAHVNVKSAKKIKKVKAASKSDHLTSWECYNVILLALTEQLIQLGASAKIKKIVKCLWMRYLEKLEVINLEQDQMPKLSLVHIKRDLRITYDVKKSSRRKRSATSKSDHSEIASKRQRSQKKAALAQSQYAEMLEKVEEGKSLQNETLTSLKSSSENSSVDREIQFNKYGNKELKKMMKKNHLETHKKDLETSLKCHKFTHKTWSHSYKNSVYFISPIKIYAVLYISLLIKKDSIQLGDLFRFLREGHLNYDRFSTLFPESYFDKTFSFHDFAKTRFFSNKSFRSTVSQLVTFLDVEEYVKCPNLVELARRYCTEMNLPDDVLNAVENVLARNPMKFGRERRKFNVPNYEARVISIVIVVLKLLYGLDGDTETGLSTYARLCNAEFPDLKFFDIRNWIKWIRYRTRVITEFHFPTSRLNNSDIKANLFLQYKRSHDISINDKNRLISDMVGYKNLLLKIQALQTDNVAEIEFPASLTPFVDHFNVIKTASKRNKFKETTFKNDSLDFLLHPKKYLRRVAIQRGSGRVNRVIEKMKNQYDSIRLIHKRDCKFVWGQIFEHSESDLLEINTNASPPVIQDVPTPSCDEINHKPFENYWLYVWGAIETAPASNRHFDEHFDKFSDSFKSIFNECARVIEVDKKELLVEFQNTELYLVYCGQYKYAEKRREMHDLPPLIRQAEDDW